MHTQRRIQSLALVGALLASVACSSKTAYITQEPIHEKAPPVWVDIPAQLTDEGFEVHGFSDNRDLTLARRLAEGDAKARALGTFEEIVRAVTKERRLSAADEAILSDARTSLSLERKGNMGGLLPVALWYDPRAQRQYVLLRMPKQRFDRLFELHGRAQVLEVLAKLNIPVEDEEETSIQ